MARPAQLHRPSGDHRRCWVQADVLNISTTGLCLALPPDLQAELQQLTQLDLRHLGDFGAQPLPVSVQWSLSHHWIATMGIAFEQPLEAIPRINGTLALQS